MSIKKNHSSKQKASIPQASPPKFKTFEDFFVEHFQDLYKLAFWLCKNPIESEDLVQETALKAFRSFQTFRSESPFKPWIFTILHNVFIDNYRKKKKAGNTSDVFEYEPDYVEEPPKYFDLEELSKFENYVDDQLKQAIHQIPENYRVVFLLHTLGDLTYEEIASTLQCPLGTVMSRLYRARNLLKQILKKEK